MLHISLQTFYRSTLRSPGISESRAAFTDCGRLTGNAEVTVVNGEKLCAADPKFGQVFPRSSSHRSNDGTGVVRRTSSPFSNGLRKLQQEGGLVHSYGVLYGAYCNPQLKAQSARERGVDSHRFTIVDFYYLKHLSASCSAVVIFDLMKTICVLLGSISLVLTAVAQQNLPASSAAESARAELQAELHSLAALAQKIADEPTKGEKARTWLELNHQAKNFAQKMNAAFPHTTIKGDHVSPAEAQQLAQTATFYGVRIEFCEPAGSWAADNQGYFKYLELWPNGPEADKATWMGPLGNASFCGDSEGSAEELREFIAQHKQFLQKFPNSLLAVQAKQDITAAEAQLQDALKSGR